MAAWWSMRTLYYDSHEEELDAIYGLTRARATHCRATQTFLLISWNRVEWQWLLDIHKMTTINLTNKLWQTEKKVFSKT